MSMKPNISDPYRSTHRGVQAPAASIPPWVKSVRENNAIQHRQTSNSVASYPQAQVIPGNTFQQQNTNTATTRAMFYGPVNPPVVKNVQSAPKIITLNEIPGFNVIPPTPFVQPVAPKQIIPHPPLHVVQAPKIVRLQAPSSQPQVVQQPFLRAVVPYSASHLTPTTNSQNFNQVQNQRTVARTENTYNTQQYHAQDRSHFGTNSGVWDKQQKSESRTAEYPTAHYPSQSDQQQISNHRQQSTANFAVKDQQESTVRRANEYHTNYYNPPHERAKETTNYRVEDEQRTVRNDYSYHNKHTANKGEMKTNQESMIRGDNSYHNKFPSHERATEVSNNYDTRDQQQSTIRSNNYYQTKHYPDQDDASERFNYKEQNTDNRYWEKNYSSDQQKETSSFENRRSNVSEIDSTYQTTQNSTQKANWYNEPSKQSKVNSYGPQSNDGASYGNREADRNRESWREESKNLPYNNSNSSAVQTSSQNYTTYIPPTNKLKSILKNSNSHYKNNQETYQKQTQENYYDGNNQKNLSRVDGHVNKTSYHKQNSLDQKRDSYSQPKPETYEKSFLSESKDTLTEHSHKTKDSADKSEISSESNVGMSHVCVCRTTEEEMAHASYFVKAYNFADLLSIISDPMIRDLQRERSLHLKALDPQLKENYGVSF